MGVFPPFTVTFNNDGTVPVDNQLVLRFSTSGSHNLEYSINGSAFSQDLGGGAMAAFADISTIVTNFGAGTNTLVLNLQQFAFNVNVAPDLGNTQQIDTTLTDTGTSHSVTINTTSAKVIHFTGSGSNDNLTVNTGQGDSTARIDNAAAVFTDEVKATDLPSLLEFEQLNTFTYQDAGIGTNVVTFATQNLSGVNATAGVSNYNVNLDNLDTLVIEGADAIDDNYGMSRPSAGQVVIRDNTTSPIVAVTLGTVGGSGPPALRVNGLGGNDTLNINVGSGVPSDVIPNAITFDGGAGSNLLNIQGNPTTVVNKAIYSPGPATGQGRLVYQNGGGTQLMSIGFANLAPVVDTMTASTLVVNGTNAPNAIDYTQGPNSGMALVGGANSGQVAVDNLETIEFANKANLVINGLGGDDTINLNNQNVVPTSLTSIRVDGGDGADTLIVNGIAGGGSATKDVFFVTPNGTGSGTLTEFFAAGATAQANFAPLAFTNLEHLSLVGQPAEGDRVIFTGTPNDDHFDVSTGPTPDSSVITGFTASPSFLFVPTQLSGFQSLSLQGLDGSDFFNVTPSPALEIQVFGGNPTPPALPGDSISVNTAGTTGFALSSLNFPTGLEGEFTFTNRKTIVFAQIETLSPLVVSPTTINATEGVPFSNVAVATFNGSVIRNFTATIDWGDGTPSSSGTVTSNGSGAFTVASGHTYAEEGSYNVSVKVTDLTFSSTQAVTSTAVVADAPLSVLSLTPGTNQQFSGVGGNNTSTTAGTANAAMTNFKAAIGGINNGATPSPQAGGFRAITWDGVALDGTDFGGTSTTIVSNFVVGIPVNRFQERGSTFGKVSAVSGPASNVDPSTFTTVNGGVSNKFPAFSPKNTFAPFNDNKIDVNFTLPSGHTTPTIGAVTRGFGAIFLNVQNPNTTSMEYFSGTSSLGKFFVPTGTSGQAEFFGVLFQNAAVTNVHIELGNATLFRFDGTNVRTGLADGPPVTNQVVTDDFVYAEPTAVSTGININAIAGTPFTAKVASFTDADPNGRVSDYSAIVDWGDGTSSSVGLAQDSGPAVTPELSPDLIITPNMNGGFDVTGTHTYTAGGTFTITTSIRDVGGASISEKSTATVAGLQGGVFQFSAPSYTVDEDNPRVDITVTRTGTTLGAASVGFATSDTAGLQPCNVFNGIASSRCDYETTIGTLQFAAGETSKSFSVPIVNDSYAEGNEVFTVSLSNPQGGATLGTPATATVTIIDDDATTGPNPIDNTEFFVRQHYLDFLGREPDPPGFAGWLSVISNCAPGNPSCDRVRVSEDFFESEEFQERGYFVYRFYSVSFGRQPSYAEFAPDLARVSGFLDVNQLETAKVAFIADFMARSAFVTKYNSLNNTQYVDTLLSTAGVTLPASTRQSLIDGLNGGTLTRAQVLRQIVESTEVATKYFNQAFVVMEYFGYLRRDPDALYLNWITFLNSGADPRTMVNGFVNSIEYRARFGP